VRYFAFHMLSFALFSFAAMDQGLAAQKQRPYQVLDDLRQEHITRMAWAPDSDLLAIVHRRSPDSQVTSLLIAEETRDHIWLWDKKSEKLRNLTNGVEDASGAWDPRWSPDGKKLAFLSTRGGLVNLWVWERDTDSIRQVTQDGVEPGSWGHYTSPSACRWLDNTSLLCAQPADKEDASTVGAGASHGETVRYATKVWGQALRGELTVSDIESTRFSAPQRNIIRVSSVTGRKRVIAAVRADQSLWQGAPPFWLSPDNKYFAAAFPKDGELPDIMGAHRIGVVGSLSLYSSTGEALHTEVQDLSPDVLLSSVKWSPDGRYLSFFAFEDKQHPKRFFATLDNLKRRGFGVASSTYPGRFYLLDVQERTVEQLALKDIYLGNGLKPPKYVWYGPERLIFHTVLNTEKHDDEAKGRWHAVDVKGVLVQGGDEIKAMQGDPNNEGGQGASFSIHETPNGSLVGQVDGKAVRLSPDGHFSYYSANGKTVPVTKYLYTLRPDRPYAISKDSKGRNVYYVLDNNSNTAFGPFEVQGSWVYGAFGISPSGELAIANLADRVLPVTVTLNSGRSKLLMELNRYAKEVKPPRQEVFDYKSLNGTELKGVITYPYGYDRKKRYPTVIDSDSGYTPTTTSLYEIRQNELPQPDALTFASAGYVYVWLSMPVNELDDHGRLNILAYTSGILPGVEELVRKGVTDPGRVFLYGVSSMGHGVLGLVTQTNRFTAATAVVTFPDPAMFALQPWLSNRYSDNPFGNRGSAAAYLGLGNLPAYFDNEMHRRNDATTYVDRVNTPLMIVAGDMFGGFMHSLEPFFTALVMQGKPATFVRYWGEGHGNTNPNNIRDYYARVVRWFDRWGDIARDANGNIAYEKGRAKSRGDTPQPSMETYRAYPVFSSEPTRP